MGAKNPVDDIECAVVAQIAQNAADRGLSVRAIAEATGIGKTRVNDLLRGETSCTVTDLTRLCDMLGLVAWKVVQQAEEGEEGDTLASSRLASPSPATGPSATGVAPVVRLPERHPRHYHPDEPLDHVPDPEDTYEPEPEPDTEPADAYHTAEGYGLAASDHEGTVETDELAMMDDGA